MNIVLSAILCFAQSAMAEPAAVVEPVAEADPQTSSESAPANPSSVNPSNIQRKVSQNSENSDDRVESAESGKNAATPTYYFWLGEASDARRPFEIALMELLFRISEDKYGKAKVEVSNWKISPRRAMQLMKKGDRLHIQSSPFLLPEFDATAVITLPYPILSNLLGYRQVIVRKEDLPEFKQLSDFSKFSEKVAGQGPGWADGKVYRANGLQVSEAPSFYNMFPMLQHKRFDYIPLGISEAEQTLAQESLKDFDFVIVDDLIIFYPWPINIMVSKAHPRLAERLSFAFELALTSGDYQKLFQQHYADVLNKMKGREFKLIELSTPDLPEGSRQQATLVEHFVRINNVSVADK